MKKKKKITFKNEQTSRLHLSSNVLQNQSRILISCKCYRFNDPKVEIGFYIFSPFPFGLHVVSG